MGATSPNGAKKSRGWQVALILGDLGLKTRKPMIRPSAGDCFSTHHRNQSETLGRWRRFGKTPLGFPGPAAPVRPGSVRGRRPPAQRQSLDSRIALLPFSERLRRLWRRHDPVMIRPTGPLGGHRNRGSFSPRLLKGLLRARPFFSRLERTTGSTFGHNLRLLLGPLFFPGSVLSTTETVPFLRRTARLEISRQLTWVSRQTVGDLSILPA